MLRFTLGALLLAVILFRVVLLLPVEIPGAMQWNWFCEKPCATTTTFKNFGSYLPMELAKYIDMTTACRTFCEQRNNLWNQLHIPAAEVKNLSTVSTKYFVSLIRRNDPILTCMMQAIVFYCFPLQVIYFLAVFMCTACARMLNGLIKLNVLFLVGMAGYHVYRMVNASRNNVDPMAITAEVGFDGLLIPLLLVLLVATTPQKVSRPKKGAKKQKQK